MSKFKVFLLSVIFVGNFGSLFAQKLFYTCHEVTVDEFHAWSQAFPQIIIFDIRNKAAYETKHIPRAIWVPNDSAIIILCDTLDSDQKIIVYDEFDNESIDACLLLASRGKADVYHLKGGFLEWERLGYLVETQKRKNK